VALPFKVAFSSQTKQGGNNSGVHAAAYTFVRLAKSCSTTAAYIVLHLTKPCSYNPVGPRLPPTLSCAWPNRASQLPPSAPGKSCPRMSSSFTECWRVWTPGNRWFVKCWPGRLGDTLFDLHNPSRRANIFL
jgi:hypothetical protein